MINGKERLIGALFYFTLLFLLILKHTFVANIQQDMRLKKKNTLVKIEAVYTPPIKTIKQVMHESGRLRQQIERNRKLSFGVVLDNKESNDIGTKVVIDDDALKAFIAECKERDNSGTPKPENGKAKRGKSLDDFMRENDML